MKTTLPAPETAPVLDLPVLVSNYDGTHLIVHHALMDRGAQVRAVEVEYENGAVVAGTVGYGGMTVFQPALPVLGARVRYGRGQEEGWTVRAARAECAGATLRVEVTVERQFPGRPLSRVGDSHCLVSVGEGKMLYYLLPAPELEGREEGEVFEVTVWAMHRNPFTSYVAPTEVRTGANPDFKWRSVGPSVGNYRRSEEEGLVVPTAAAALEPVMVALAPPRERVAGARRAVLPGLPKREVGK